ncbi:MAG: alanine:cation symporter family protein, partial [Pseudomonadota bacterium]
MQDQDGGLAEAIDNALAPAAQILNDIVFASIPLGPVDLPVVVLWLAAASIVFTVATGFINIRGFRQGFRFLLRDNDPDHPGEISAFQALSAALSGTVGLGNIVSVPVAISLGGPGALFWMIVAGFFGMTSKFVECAMAVKYRRVRPDGTVSGGPMYYIETVFSRMGSPALGKALGVFFAICTLGGSVSILQVNQAHAQFAT